MFLGIEYDKWHGILAFAGFVGFFVILFFLFGGFLISTVGGGSAMLSMIAIAFLLVHHLQAWNEARQAIAGGVTNTYRTWSNFILDSREDWGYFWKGIRYGFVGIVIFLFVVYIIIPLL